MQVPVNELLLEKWGWIKWEHSYKPVLWITAAVRAAVILIIAHLLISHNQEFNSTVVWNARMFNKKKKTQLNIVFFFSLIFCFSLSQAFFDKDYISSHPEEMERINQLKELMQEQVRTTNKSS